MSASPIDATDIEAEVDVGLVLRHAQRFELQRRRDGRRGRRRGIHDGAATPIRSVAVNRDSRGLSSGSHRDYTVILFCVERIEPKPLAVERVFEVDHDPVLLEPLVNQLEQSRARCARFVDVPGQTRVDRRLLLVRQPAVIPSLGLEMTDAAR